MENKTVRNIALHRAVYHSSCANSGNTGHLVTDGFLEEVQDIDNPVVISQHADSPAGESAEYAFDGSTVTKFYTHQCPSWVEYRFPGDRAVEVAGYVITTANDIPDRDPRSWTLYGVGEGGTLTAIAAVSDYEFPTDRYSSATFPVEKPGAYKAYRLDVTAVRGGSNLQFAELSFLDAQGNPIHTPYVMPYDDSWRSKGAQDEYLYIDLGGESRFDRVTLRWDKVNYAKFYDIQVSDDAEHWTTVYSTEDGQGGEETVTFAPVRATYVKLFARRSAGSQFKLFAFEVYGTNDVTMPTPPPLPAPKADGTQYLHGGNWRVQRAEQVAATGETLSTAGYDDGDWIPAVMPGTVLTSYLAIGAIPDPYYGDQNNLISDSFFTADFWYRDSFPIPAARQGQRVLLNFGSINWKADVYLNGHNAGSIHGAFLRGCFDVTEWVNWGGENILAVLIHKNDTPDALRYDNPTIEPSAQWDWMPRVRGRDIGIYGEVFVRYTGDVRLADPWVETHPDLRDFSSADLIVRAEVKNAADHDVTATVRGSITEAGLTYEQTVTVPARGVTAVEIPLTMQNPQLWWPNRYGEQFLYQNEMTVELDGRVSDTNSFRFGVRELTYQEDVTKPLAVYVNGVRIYCSGGNWGMSEMLLRCNTAEEYDTRIRLHKEENFCMIRNWGGETYSEHFYNACDKYGMLIFDDFWMASGEWQQGFSGLPNDQDMFVENAIDKIKFVRRHPCLAFYSGRNEGRVPEPLNGRLQRAVDEYDGVRNYYSSSAHDQLTGWGPYSVQEDGAAFYFKNSAATFHSERGIPNIPVLETMESMMPKKYWWPVNFMWMVHDFHDGNQKKDAYLAYTEKMYGPSDSLPQFVRRAQLVNYETHKAMFEAPSLVGGHAMLMWMSQSAWPSLVWQSYDYYFDTNAAYFGIKAGNQPVNAVYDCANQQIAVANNSGKAYTGLTLTMSVYDMNGRLADNRCMRFDLACDEVKRDLFGTPVTRDMTDTNVNFIKLKIIDGAEETVSENFYWMTLSEDCRDLQTLSEVTLQTSHTARTEGTTRFLQATVRNTSDTPALLIRVKTLTDVSGERVLPAYYSDNYFSLMPGESREITVEFDEQALHGEQPRLFVEGWNVKAAAFD